LCGISKQSKRDGLMWTLIGWLIIFIGALVITLALVAEVWQGWREAKTKQQKLYWWLRVITLIFVAFVVLYFYRGVLYPLVVHMLSKAAISKITLS
jgi:uncharacterized membrane protein